MTTDQNTDTPLGTRLRRAFGGARNSEIARRLGCHDSTAHAAAVAGYISARSLLLAVEATGCDPAWLLTARPLAPNAGHLELASAITEARAILHTLSRPSL